MSYFTSLAISSSGMTVERMRVDLASANLANANSTSTPEGGPYLRRDPVITSVPVSGAFGDRLERSIQAVRVSRIVTDPSPPREIYDPHHPDADGNGMLKLPNVQVVAETVNLLNAQRSYEANIAALESNRAMADRALRIGRT